MSGGDGMGGDMGGGDVTMGMESMKPVDKYDFLFEDDLELPSPKRDMTDLTRTPDDNSIGNDDPVKGNPVAMLSIIQRLRHAHFSKRVDWQKRLKMLNRIYAPAADEGGPPGLGGL